MAWIEVHQSLKDHRKLLVLSGLLDISPVHTLGHLVSLWLWALDNAPSGDLSNIPDGVIAAAAQWENREISFVWSLQAAGFLDEKKIHDWFDYAGRLIINRESHREYMRRLRARHVPYTLQEHAKHVPVTDEATVPNRTQPNRTVPKEESKKKVKSERVYHAFGELMNITLTLEDHEKLVTRFGAQGANDWIEELSLAKASKGYKTKSDYATILAWEHRDKKLQDQNKKGVNGGGNGTSTKRSDSRQGIPGNRPAGAFSDIEDHDP